MKNTINGLTLILYLVIGLLFWLLSHYTPLDLVDDLTMRFVIGEELVPVKSISDCLVSAYNYYVTLIGRIPTVFLVALFDGVLGKVVFDICNSIAFCLLSYCLVRYTQHKDYFFTTSLIFFSFIFFIPSFQETHLWLNGSISYMWVALQILTFLIVFRKYAPLHLSYHLLWLCPFSLIVGMANESFSLPLSFGLLVYLYVNKKSLLNISALPIVLFFVVGTMVIVFAPGTLQRANVHNNITIIYVLKCLTAGMYSLFFSLRLFWFFIIGVIIRYWHDWGKAKQFLCQHPIEFSAMLVSPLIFFTNTAFYGGRICYATEIFSLIMILHLLATINMPFYNKALSLPLLIVVFVAYVPIISDLKKNYDNSRYVMDQLEHKDRLVRIPLLLDSNWIEKRFVHPIIIFGESSTHFPLDPSSRNNMNASFLYKIPGLVFIPDEIYSFLSERSMNSNFFYTNNGWPYFVKKLIVDQKVENVKLILKATDYLSLPFYLRPIAPNLDKYRCEELTTRNKVVKIAGVDYLFVEKSVPEVNSRIYSIKVSYLN